MAQRGFETLSTELLQKIYYVCPSIEDAVALSSTCRFARAAFNGSHKLPIVEAIVEYNYGPTSDAIALVTYVDNGSFIASGAPAISLALLKQVEKVGKVADQYADLYPMEKWKFNYESRRRLTSHERHKLRRAVYRIWLYSDIFHTTQRLAIPSNYLVQQSSFLGKFSSKEAEELLDMDYIFGSIILELCPDNGAISMRATEQYPDQQLYFGSLSSSAYRGNSGLLPTAIESESWGDFITAAGIVGELKKLNPLQLLHFRDLKGSQERKEFLREMDWKYGGRFRGTWSQLPRHLLEYLKIDDEEVTTEGGIIAADD